MYRKLILFLCGSVFVVKSDNLKSYKTSSSKGNLIAAAEKVEATTFKYPTATWSAENYAKKKSMEEMWKLYLFKPSPFLKPPFTDGETGATISRIEDGLNVNGHRRSKVSNRQETRKVEENNVSERTSILSDSKIMLHDKLLEEALHKYIKSANLTDEFGTITLEMFTEALKKITTSKKHTPAYEENMAVHRKFKDNLMSKINKTETVMVAPAGGLVEKQYKKRLNNKSWEIINENISVPSRSAFLDPKEDWKPVEITTIKTDSSYTKKTSPVEVLTFTTMEITKPTESTTSLNHHKSSKKTYPKKSPKQSRGTKKYRDTVPRESEMEELQLLAAESVYYGSRQQNLPETSHKKAAEYGAIPGTPDVDYPRHSFPPKTDFTCPRVAKGTSIMIADPKTRCQVFYLCTGDAPPTPMLCPNGTVFNGHVHVCDWWFNVDC